MYALSNKSVRKLEPVTFSELQLLESDIEEILRNNIDLIDDEEESMLVVGQQVRNTSNGRSDLTAVDSKGNIVLIEVKRDMKDERQRKEAFEFQAIRYAASYAKIKDTEELVDKVYAPYISTYKNEFELNSLTAKERAMRELNEFLESNKMTGDFNSRQRIILVSSGYDEQTLSAVAWLTENGVDISCYKLVPYKDDEQTYLHSEKILPATVSEDYYIDIAVKRTAASVGRQGKIKRRRLPKIDAMLEWGVVKAGDALKAKDHDDAKAILLSNGYVDVDGEELSMQTWLKRVYGWASVQTYAFAMHVESNRTLLDIREEYMDKQVEKEEDESL